MELRKRLSKSIYHVGRSDAIRTAFKVRPPYLNSPFVEKKINKKPLLTMLQNTRIWVCTVCITIVRIKLFKKKKNYIISDKKYIYYYVIDTLRDIEK